MATYIDVTRILAWEGNYTGMERFAFEITRSLKGSIKPNVKLCFFSQTKGFIELKTSFSMKDGRLTSPLMGPNPSLKNLFRSDKKAFIQHYSARRKQKILHKDLDSIVPTKDDTMIIYDGLWGNNEYVGELLRIAGRGAHLVHVVCDLVPIVMPNVCFDYVTEAFTSYFDEVAPHIDTLISISKNTQKDFIKIYGSVIKPSIHKEVVRFGDKLETAKAAEKPDALPINENDYILTVGTVESRKNHQLLYQAYKLAKEQNVELPKLVIVGREGWMAEPTIYSLKNDPELKDKIIFAGPISDSNLKWLYGNCLFTVFPSVYEGWGLPVAESLFYGKVCAASDSSSIPEIGGDMNKYYSPYNSEECLRTIESLLDSSLRKKLEDKISKDYVTTSWEHAAKSIINSLKTV